MALTMESVAEEYGLAIGQKFSIEVDEESSGLIYKFTNDGVSTYSTKLDSWITANNVLAALISGSAEVDGKSMDVETLKDSCELLISQGKGSVPVSVLDDRYEDGKRQVVRLDQTAVLII